MNPVSPPIPAPAMTRPLCVDLDGSLVLSDTLHESVLLLAKQHPLDLLRLTGWLAGGKAKLKSYLSERVVPDPAALPYCQELVEFLKSEKAAGRRLVLATASHRRVAEGVAEHLGIFDEVVASDQTGNLKGSAKLAALEARFGKGGFDYVGNSSADLPLWAACGTSYAVNPSARLTRRMAQPCARVFRSPGRAVSGVLKALRPHQWFKNVLVAVPLVLAHATHDVQKLLAVLLAMVAFSFCASAVYVCNDLLDLEADRHHPRKRHRPFASGALSIPAGMVLLALLLVGAFSFAALTFRWAFVGVLALYFVMSSSYSFYFKRKLLVDVVILAGLYTLRIIAGAAAADVPLTSWLLAFAMFLFLSLAFAKRYSELIIAQEREEQGLRGRGYLVDDLRVIESVGPTSGYLAVLVLCLYIDSTLVKSLYHYPRVLWLICPLILYWITRIWFFARRRYLHDDPLVFALTDRISWVIGILTVMVILAARPMHL